MPKKDEKIVKVVAEFEVTSEFYGMTVTVKTFDAAWRMLMELPSPAHMRFIKFTRTD